MLELKTSAVAEMSASRWPGMTLTGKTALSSHCARRPYIDRAESFLGPDGIGRAPT